MLRGQEILLPHWLRCALSSVSYVSVLEFLCHFSGCDISTALSSNHEPVYLWSPEAEGCLRERP